jgi:hypothetical protein
VECAGVVGAVLGVTVGAGAAVLVLRPYRSVVQSTSSVLGALAAAVALSIRLKTADSPAADVAALVGTILTIVNGAAQTLWSALLMWEPMDERLCKMRAARALAVERAEIFAFHQRTASSWDWQDDLDEGDLVAARAELVNTGGASLPRSFEMQRVNLEDDEPETHQLEELLLIGPTTNARDDIGADGDWTWATATIGVVDGRHTKPRIAAANDIDDPNSVAARRREMQRLLAEGPV